MLRGISRLYTTSLKNRTKLIRKRAMYRFKIFFRYYLKRQEKDPVFIITTRRTGSNLLLGYLNSIPRVSFAPEILNKSMSYGIRSKFISKKAVLRHIRHSINASKEKTCGTKFVKLHLESHKITLENLKEYFPNARFIILYRRSLMDQFVSLRIAETTNTWHWTSQFCPPSSLRVQIPELLEFCKKIKIFYRDIFRRAWLKECSIALSYEELVQSPQETFERVVFPFLKLPPVPVASSTKKQNTKQLREIIQNYADIVPWIQHPLTWQDYSNLKSWPAEAETLRFTENST